MSDLNSSRSVAHIHALFIAFAKDTLSKVDVKLTNKDRRMCIRPSHSSNETYVVVTCPSEVKLGYFQMDLCTGRSNIHDFEVLDTVVYVCEMKQIIQFIEDIIGMLRLQ